MDLKVRLIITVLLLAGFLISNLLYKWIKKKHKEDPVFQEEQRRREEAYKQRIEEENASLQNYEFSGYDDSDDEMSESQEMAEN